MHLAASEEVVVASALVRCSEDSEAGVHPDLYSGTGRLAWALRELVGTHDAKGEGGAEFLQMNFRRNCPIAQCPAT